MNGQNCRKSSQLSMMLLVHKIMIRTPSEIGKKIYADLLSTYLSMFREVASLIFDLGPFFYHIKGTQVANDLVQQLQSYYDDTTTQPERRCRVLLNLRKMEQVLEVRSDRAQRLK